MTTTTESVVLADDLFSDANLEHPEGIDRKIREAAPLVYLEQYGVFATGRYNLVQQIFHDWETFSSAYGTGLRNIRREGNWREKSSILDVDPPEHTRTRKVMSKVLSLKNIRRLQDSFQRTADELVERLLERASFDAAKDLAEAYPLSALPDAVGMANEGREHLLPYSKVNFQAMGPRNGRYEAAVQAAGNAAEYVAWQMRRGSLAPGGLGAQIFEAVDAGELSEHEGEKLVRTFLSAGLDTTIYGIGLTIRHLAENPSQWQLLKGHPELARAAFEETLRFTPPSPRIGRTTRVAVQIGGVQLDAEQKILLMLGAANRDPEQWKDPERYDLSRTASGHLAFGTGLHGCVGQMVARMEAECVLSAVARKIGRIEIIGEPEPVVNHWLRGLESLPVHVTAAV
jgi:cytochrome P450